MIITFILICIILGVVTFDQISKLLVVCFMDINQEIDILPGLFRFKYITNYGMSFGLFDTPEKRPIFMIIAPIALIAIAVYLFKFSKDKLPMKIGLAFIFGGGFSNMIDRTFYGDVLFHGEVIDMFDFYGIWHAIFNVADAFVCIGAALVILTLIVEIILEGKEKKEACIDISGAVGEVRVYTVDEKHSYEHTDTLNAMGLSVELEPNTFKVIKYGK